MLVLRKEQMSNNSPIYVVKYVMLNVET